MRTCSKLQHTSINIIFYAGCVISNQQQVSRSEIPVPLYINNHPWIFNSRITPSSEST